MASAIQTWKLKHKDVLQIWSTSLSTVMSETLRHMHLEAAYRRARLQKDQEDHQKWLKLMELMGW
jgi:hypothetical protein